MIGQLIGGLIVGLIARLLMPGKEALPAGILGWLLTAVLGIAGAFVGGFIASTLWSGNATGGWIMSIIGAMILLFLLRLIVGKGSAS